MRLKIILQHLYTSIDSLNERVGRTVAWLTLAMVGLQCTIVVLRYAFSWNRIYLQEVVIYLYTLVFMLGIGYTLRHNAHVRVDIFYRALSHHGQTLVNLFGTLLLLLPTTIFIFYISWDYVAESWRIREASRDTGGLPALYLLKSMLLVMAGLVTLQGIAEVLRNTLILLESYPER